MSYQITVRNGRLEDVFGTFASVHEADNRSARIAWSNRVAPVAPRPVHEVPAHLTTAAITATEARYIKRALFGIDKAQRHADPIVTDDAEFKKLMRQFKRDTRINLARKPGSAGADLGEIVLPAAVVTGAINLGSYRLVHGREYVLLEDYQAALAGLHVDSTPVDADTIAANTKRKAAKAARKAALNEARKLRRLRETRRANRAKNARARKSEATPKQVVTKTDKAAIAEKVATVKAARTGGKSGFTHTVNAARVWDPMLSLTVVSVGPPKFIRFKEDGSVKEAAKEAKWVTEDLMI